MIQLLSSTYQLIYYMFSIFTLFWLPFTNQTLLLLFTCIYANTFAHHSFLPLTQSIQDHFLSVSFSISQTEKLLVLILQFTIAEVMPLFHSFLKENYKSKLICHVCEHKDLEHKDINFTPNSPQLNYTKFFVVLFWFMDLNKLILK